MPCEVMDPHICLLFLSGRPAQSSPSHTILSRQKRFKPSTWHNWVAWKLQACRFCYCSRILQDQKFAYSRGKHIPNARPLSPGQLYISRPEIVCSLLFVIYTLVRRCSSRYILQTIKSKQFPVWRYTVARARVAEHSFERRTLVMYMWNMFTSRISEFLILQDSTAVAKSTSL
jgi:hypothetical protein